MKAAKFEKKEGCSKIEKKIFFFKELTRRLVLKACSSHIFEYVQ